MAKRKILTKEQCILHNDPKLYAAFTEKFPEGENFYNYEDPDHLFDEEEIKKMVRPNRQYLQILSYRTQ